MLKTHNKDQAEELNYCWQCPDLLQGELQRDEDEEGEQRKRRAWWRVAEGGGVEGENGEE